MPQLTNVGDLECFWKWSFSSTNNLQDWQSVETACVNPLKTTPFVWDPEQTEAFEAIKRKSPVQPYWSIMIQINLSSYKRNKLMGLGSVLP